MLQRLPHQGGRGGGFGFLTGFGAFGFRGAFGLEGFGALGALGGDGGGLGFWISQVARHEKSLLVIAGAAAITISRPMTRIIVFIGFGFV